MKYKRLLSVILLSAIFIGISGSLSAIDPSNPNATPEARALLDLFYRISGKYTLTGQHNFPSTRDYNSRFAATYVGQTPAVWSSDMGFAKEGDKDCYLSRPDIVKEAIQQHKKGSVITICWHAVPPTADEPVTFQPVGHPAPDSLASVQGKMLPEQYKELLTPGTRLYTRWARQVDSVAVYLKKLQDAKVPVLWRPYHEMNGDWFWWGGLVGEYGTIAIYRQLYDRLVNYHKLNNLVWIWSTDRASSPERKYTNYYPGNNYLDIVGLDVYGSDFNQAYYDSLEVLSKGKPMVLAEVGNPPAMDVFKKQPKWGYWVIWSGMVRGTSLKQYHEIINDPRMLSQEDPSYWEVMAPFRKACGLPLLPLKFKYPVNFSGKWIFNEEKSEPGRGGADMVSYKMQIDQDNDLVLAKKYSTEEWGEERILNDEILLDGTETKSVFFNSPKVTKAVFDASTNSIKISSVVKFTRDGRTNEFRSTEEWSLAEGGKILKIVQISPSLFGDSGENKVTLIYEKQ